MMKVKKKLKIEIELEPILKDINKYIKRKIQDELRKEYEYNWSEMVNVDLPNINFPKIEKRLETLEMWKEDLENGFIRLKQNKKK